MTTDTEFIGLAPTDRSNVIHTLVEAGFPRAHAEAWVDCWNHWADPCFVAAQAIAYGNHGIPLDQAIPWLKLGFLASDAIGFYDRCFTPEQAATVSDIALHDNLIAAWLLTNLPAEKVIAYLQAGVTLNEYKAFEASDDSSDEALALLAGFLQAP